MPFYFAGRTFAGADRLKLTSPIVTPPGAGLIGLCRPTAATFFNGGFYSPGGAGGWVVGRAPTGAANPARLGLYRPLRTPIFQVGVAAAANTVTTAPFSPPANCTLIAWSVCRDLAAVNTSTMTTGGLTWTLIPGADVTVNDGATFLRQRAFSTSIGASPPANITAATTTTGADHNACYVLAVPGGGTSFQVATGTGSDGDATATLATAPAANSVVVGSYHTQTFAASVTPPTGYTEASYGNVGTNSKFQTVYDEDVSDPAVVWVTTNLLCTAIAIEVKCPPLVEHSSANWVDNRTQSFLAFSASASEHYLALNDASSLQKFTTTVPIDATTALAMGRMDMAVPRGGLAGDLYWLGALKAMPPTGPLDAVMRQIAPPTILRPWLAHLWPLQGRSSERCVITGTSLTVDVGTTVAVTGVPQPQEEIEEATVQASVGVPMRLVRITARHASGDTVLTVDGGLLSEAAAILVELPAPGGTALAVSVNGATPTTATLPSVAPAQQGNLIVGSPILDGAAQTQSGNRYLGAIALGPAATAGVRTDMWAIAESYLRPVIDPISLTGETATPYSENLAPRIKDPARAGYTLSLSGISAGLTASISGGTSFNYQAAAVGTYGATLTITSLLSGPLTPSTQVTISVHIVGVVARFANGYQYRAMIRMPAWSSGGLETTHLLPFAEVGQRFMSVANGGLAETAGWDFRFELPDGSQIAHRNLGYDGATGRAPALLNFERNLANEEFIWVYLGKPGMLQSEENITLARRNEWAAWHNGWDLLDYTGFGHTLASSGTVTASAIGAWPAGQYNGSSTYRFRTSNELNADNGFFVAALVQTNETIGRSQEFLNIAPNDTAQLAMRLSGTGQWVTVADVGGQVVNVTSDTGLYGQGEPHALAVHWTSGSAMGAVLDGRVIDPVTPPPVATGNTAMDESLEIGRGNRPPGTSSYWNGFIGPILMSNYEQTPTQREVITAALKQPRLVYGISDFQQVGETGQPTTVTLKAQGVAAASAPSASFTPIAGSVLMAIGIAREETGSPPSPTISHTGTTLTWTQVASNLNSLGSGADTHQRVWIAQVPTTVSSTVVTVTSAAADAVLVGVFEIINGTTTIVQSASNEFAEETGSINFATAPLASSLIIGIDGYGGTADLGVTGTFTMAGEPAGAVGSFSLGMAVAWAMNRTATSLGFSGGIVGGSAGAGIVVALEMQVIATNQPFCALPMQGNAERNTSTAFDVVAAAYNPGGAALTVSVPTQPFNVATSVSGNSVLVNPNNTANSRVLVTYLLSSSGLSSSGVIDLGVGPVDPGGGTDELPAGYPEIPTFGTITVTVSTASELNSAISSAGAAGKTIQLNPGNYGGITIDRPGAKIKLVGVAPPFEGLVTERSALDSVNLTPTNDSDTPVITNCIPGGLLAHTATARIDLELINANVLWIEGLDFYSPGVNADGARTYGFLANRGSGKVAPAGEQIWIRKCRFDRTDTVMIGLGGGSAGAGTNSYRGPDILVVWECYFYGEGTIGDPGTSGDASGGVLTDYGVQMYSCFQGSIAGVGGYIYKSIFSGGYNHSISTKQLVKAELRVDDCVFANWHPANNDAHNYIEAGQTGSKSGEDRTSALIAVRGSTFTGVGSGGRVMFLKDGRGFYFENNAVYAGGGTFFISGAGNTQTANEQGGLICGSGGVTIKGCTFRTPGGANAQPPTTALPNIYSGTGGGYQFRAENNTVSSNRAVTSKGSKNSTSYGTNPGFSG